MSKKELKEEIDREIGSSTEFSAQDLKVEDCCTHCGCDMSYERYNEHSPQSDYILHITPGSDAEPPEKLLYCGPSCFIEEMDELTAGAVQ